MYNAPGGSITVYHTSGHENFSSPLRLPPPPTLFVNRDEELEALGQLLTAPADSQHRIVVLLSGPGGVGKTGLALYWANEVSSLYPDGLFFRNLSGYGPGTGDKPANPYDVLADWLFLGWNLKGSEIPTSREGRAELFRAKTSGQRMLVILDNAARAEQVRPLLPSESCLVIVTSRNRLPGLISEGAHSVMVNPLSPENAVQLLRARLGDRIDEDPASASQLAKYCACLPLTLHTAATRLGNEPNGSIATQVQRLSDVRRRLHRLGHPDDRQTDVEAVNSVSYQTLPADAQRLFRLMALHPSAGNTAKVYSIARLAGLDLDSTEDLLERLCTESLISKSGDRYGSLHDVLHLFARKLIDQDEFAAERREALDRLAHAYYGSVNYAFDRVNRDNPMVDSEFLAAWRQSDFEGILYVDDSGKPAAWFADERINLVAFIRTLGDIVPPLPITSRLACGLFYFLETGGHLADWDEVEKIAAQMAFASGSRHDQARSLRNQARIKLVKILNEKEWRHSDSLAEPTAAEGYDDAIAMLRRSRDLFRAEYATYRRSWDRAGEATALREMADLYRLSADSNSTELVDRAIDAYLQAEAALEELGNDNGLASLRLALSLAYALKDDQVDLEQAERYVRASLDYSCEPNDIGSSQHPRLKGYALRHFGDLRLRSGNFAEALSYYEQSISTFSDAKDAISQGRALMQLGRILTDYYRVLLAADDQAAGSDALARARSSFIEAREVLSDFPVQVQAINDWLSQVDMLATVNSASADEVLDGG